MVAENGTILERFSTIGSRERNGNGKLSITRKRKGNGKLYKNRLRNWNGKLYKKFGNVSTTGP